MDIFKEMEQEQKRLIGFFFTIPFFVNVNITIKRYNKMNIQKLGKKIEQYTIIFGSEVTI